jgi:Na+/alanine symporter
MLRVNKEAFTFSQIALIILALIILIGLIIVIVMQKDHIVSVINDIFSAGEDATQGFEEVVEELTSLVPLVLWQVKRR